MRLRTTTVAAMVLGVMASLLPTAANATAAPLERTYWQACTGVQPPGGGFTMGVICMDVRGRIGTNGTIGISYRHDVGVKYSNSLHMTYHGNPSFPGAVWHGVGSSPGTITRTTFITAGCVAYPAMQIYRAGKPTVRRNGGCVNVQP